MCMTPHGPDAATFERAVANDGDAPEHLPRDTLAFMFEVRAAPARRETRDHVRGAHLSKRINQWTVCHMLVGTRRRVMKHLQQDVLGI